MLRCIFFSIHINRFNDEMFLDPFVSVAELFGSPCSFLVSHIQNNSFTGLANIGLLLSSVSRYITVIISTYYSLVHFFLIFTTLFRTNFLSRCTPPFFILHIFCPNDFFSISDFPNFNFFFYFIWSCPLAHCPHDSDPYKTNAPHS